MTVGQKTELVRVRDETSFVSFFKLLTDALLTTDNYIKTDTMNTSRMFLYDSSQNVNTHTHTYTRIDSSANE